VPCIVVLSMHRSGSSLTASILQSLGVYIGTELLGTHPSQPYGHFENVKFYRLNVDILKAAGGNWANPPPDGAIMAVKPQFKERIIRTIQEESRDLWGFKCPRTCLTIPLYLPYLKDPRFILVYRDPIAIAASLSKRSGTPPDGWVNLIKVYQRAMEIYAIGYPVIRVNYDVLMCEDRAEREVGYLNSFIGGNGDIETALGNIHFRKNDTES